MKEIELKNKRQRREKQFLQEDGSVILKLYNEDIHFKKQHQKYKGWVAQIIQHEVDHCEGIII